MRAYTYPPVGGSSISAWRGGYCLLMVWACRSLYNNNQTSLHAIFLYSPLTNNTLIRETKKEIK